MIMTRKKDIFWAVYAALIPYIFINVSADITWRLNEYRSRTYNAAGPMMGIFAMAVLMGIILASLAMHYLSRPIETSKAPKIGLIIGLTYCIAAALYWPILFIGSINTELLFKLLPARGGETQIHIFLGFYIFMLAYYLKNHTFMTKDELMKDVETENKAED